MEPGLPYPDRLCSGRAEKNKLERYRTMKNSLFKRALAAVSTVPLALTQCLTVANAAYFSDTALSLNEGAKATEARTITLTGKGGLLYIEPADSSSTDDYYKYNVVSQGKGEDGVERIVLEKYSNWDEVAWTVIESLKGKTGDVDLTKAYDKVISMSGNYSDVVSGIADNMSDVHYEVSQEGDILLSADLSNITPVLTADLQGAIGEGMQKIADTYGLPVLEEPQIFDDIIIAGQFNGVIHTSTLEGGKSVVGEISFTDSDGRVFKGAGMVDYVIEKISALKQRAKDTVEEHKNEVENIEEVYKDIDNSFSFILDNLAKGKSAFNKAYAHDNNYSRTATDVADAIRQGKEFLTQSSKVKEFLNSKRGQQVLNSSYAQKILGGQSFEAYVNSLPDTASGLIAKAMEYDRVNSIYGTILDKFNQELAESVFVDIEMPEVGEEADKLTNLSATLVDHIATGYAEYPDEEIEEVRTYLEDAYPGYRLDSSIKTVEVKVDFDQINGNIDGAGNAGSAEGTLDYKRVAVLVKDDEQTTTTTTGETTTSTDTETTTTESETTDSDTSTTDTETTTTGTDIDTSETTDTETTETTETDTTDTTDTETTTTDTDTDTTDTDDTTTTTSTTDIVGTEDPGSVTTTTEDTDLPFETTTDEVSIPTTPHTSTTESETTVSDDTTTSTDTGTVTQEPADLSTTESSSNTDDIGDDTRDTSTTTSTGTGTTASTEPGETRTVVTTAVNYYAKTEVGFYLNVDEEFHKEQISSLSYSVDEITEYYDADDNLISYEVTKEGEKHDIIDLVTFGDKTPNNTYEEDNALHAYQVSLIASEAIVDPETGFVVAENAGDTLRYVDGQAVSITVYIGVKGDANLDNMADARDASDVLAWYAAMSTGGLASETIFAQNCALVESASDDLDHFAAFLCDVDNEPGVVEDNWKLRKAERGIDARDASSILAYYALVSTGEEGGRPTWNKVGGVPHTEEPIE